jgi:hypothetical protein
VRSAIFDSMMGPVAIVRLDPAGDATSRAPVLRRPDLLLLLKLRWNRPMQLLPSRCVNQSQLLELWLNRFLLVDSQGLPVTWLGV